MSSILIPLVERFALRKAANDLVELFYASQGEDLLPVVSLGHFLHALGQQSPEQTDDLIRLLYLMRQNDVAGLVRFFKTWQVSGTILDLCEKYRAAVQGNLDAFSDLVDLAADAENHLDTLKDLGLACPEALAFIGAARQFK